MTSSPTIFSDLSPSLFTRTIPSSKFSKALHDFVIDLSLTDSTLYIEAENQKTFCAYYYEVNMTNVADLTEHLYPDIVSFFNGLKDTLENPKDQAKASIDEKAKLTFIYSLAIGPITRKWEFSIQLAEVKLDRTDKLEREVTRLRKEVNQVNQRFDAQKPSASQDLRKLLDRMNKIEDLFDEQKKKSQESNELLNFAIGLEKTKIKLLFNEQMKGLDNFESLQCVFDPDSAQKANFDLSDNNKTITRNANSNGTFFAMFTKDALPSTKRYKFSVKINKVSNEKNVAIGIAAGSLKNQISVYSSSGAFFFQFNDNTFYHNGTAEQIPASIKVYEGDILTFFIDVDNQIIRADVNEIPLFRLKVDLSTSSNTGLYPCVDLGENLSAVTFIDDLKVVI